MPLTQQLALVPENVGIGMSELTRVASALSKQVTRDFTPIWNVHATVDAFATLDDVPSDYWPVIVVADVKDAAGFHDDQHGQPFALVEFDQDWSLTASHECLEMLADPFGRRLRAGTTPEQAIKLGLPERRVRYLLEVCDPSEDGAFAYTVNGVLVSDFYTPEYFDPVPVSTVRYSFTGAIKRPRTVLKEGYLSWHDSVTGHWMQLRHFADELSNKTPHVVDLNTDTLFSQMLQSGMSTRSAIDRVTSTARRVQRGGKSAPPITKGAAKRGDDANAGQCGMWRVQIERLRGGAGNGGGTAPRGRKRPR